MKTHFVIYTMDHAGKICKGTLNSQVGKDFVCLAEKWRLDIDSEDFARRLDEEDPLRNFKKLFHYPKKNLEFVKTNSTHEETEDCIYFCGHSLGLQLKSIENDIQRVLANWATRGVECHFAGHFPAALSDIPVKEKMALLVGADPNEIAFMNGLTVNIHIMLGSFYRPTPNRYKILMVHKGFHSDLYAVESHIALRGYDPETGIIFLKPRPGEHTINPDDILKVIREEGASIALTFMEGVHYYTGELYDMKEITRVAKEQGCVVGFDLAHAVGNVKLQLHDWNIDFAVWCTYKYLNSGPGCMAAVYTHRRHTQEVDAVGPSLRGWWGLHPDRKFAFDREFTPDIGADRYKMSNPSPYLTTMILQNLEVFDKAGTDRLLTKQRLLTGYLEYLLRKNFPQDVRSEHNFQIITPSDPGRRGSQISLLFSINISEFDELLKEKGIICDVRKPSVLRVTPIPLYNTFLEVHRFVHVFKDIWKLHVQNDRKS